MILNGAVPGFKPSAVTGIAKCCIYIYILGSVLLGSRGGGGGWWEVVGYARFKLSAVTGIAKRCIFSRINIFLSTLFCI